MTDQWREAPSPPLNFAPVGNPVYLPQGGQISLPWRVKTGARQPIDLTHWTVSASCAFKTGVLVRGNWKDMEAGGSPVPAKVFQVRKADQAGTLVGFCYIDIPHDALPSTYDVPPNPAEDSIGLVTVTAESDDHVAQIYKGRFPIVWRDSDGE